MVGFYIQARSIKIILVALMLPDCFKDKIKVMCFNSQAKVRIEYLEHRGFIQ